MDDISDENIFDLRIPNSIPLVYRLDMTTLQPVRCTLLAFGVGVNKRVPGSFIIVFLLSYCIKHVMHYYVKGVRSFLDALRASFDLTVSSLLAILFFVVFLVILGGRVGCVGVSGRVLDLLAAGLHGGASR